MALDTYAIITVEYLKGIMGLTDESNRATGIALYHDAGASATAATAAVLSTGLSLVITGGANAGTDTSVTWAANTTIGAVVTAINALAKGWVASAYGIDAAASTSMATSTATSAYGTANTQYLQIISDYRLERIIDSVTHEIEQYTNVRWVSRTFRQRYADCGGEIKLREFPVTDVKRVAVGRQNAIRLAYGGTNANPLARVLPVTNVANISFDDFNALSVILTSGGTDTTVLIASFTTLATLVTEINTKSGWTATREYTQYAAGSHPTLDLIPMAACSVQGQNAYLEIPGDNMSRPDFDPRTGYLRASALGWPYSLSGGGYGDIFVEYAAGWGTVPYDVQRKAAELCKEVYDDTMTSGGLTAERIGAYQYSRAGPAVTSLGIAPVRTSSLEDKLFSHRRIPV